MNAYRRDHRGDWPRNLASLVPRYIADQRTLHCPALPDGSPTDQPPVISYFYEFSADRIDYPGILLGPVRLKPGQSTRRDCKLAQRVFFGDRVPVAHCSNHYESPPPRPPVTFFTLYLTLDGTVAKTQGFWEVDPDSCIAMLRRMDRALVSGSFSRRWTPRLVTNYFANFMKGPGPAVRRPPMTPSLRRLLRRDAGRLSARAARHPGERADLTGLAGTLRLLAGDRRQAMAVLERARKLPGAPPAVSAILAYAHTEIGHTGRGLDLMEDQLLRRGHDYGTILYLTDHYRRTGTMARGIRFLESYHARLSAGLPKNFPAARNVALFLRGIFEEKRDTAKCREWTAKADPGRGLVGRAAPEFSFTDRDGNPIHLASLRGKVVLLNFWAYSCVPCLVEAPHLNALYEKNRNRGLVVLGIHADPNEAEGRKAASRFTFPVILKAGDMPLVYGVTGLPTSYVIDRDGTVMERYEGFNAEKVRRVEQRIEPLLSASAIAK